MSKDISFSYERPMDDESKERFRKFSELYWYSIEKSKTEFDSSGNHGCRRYDFGRSRMSGISG